MRQVEGERLFRSCEVNPTTALRLLLSTDPKMIGSAAVAHAQQGAQTYAVYMDHIPFHAPGTVSRSRCFHGYHISHTAGSCPAIS